MRFRRFALGLLMLQSCATPRPSLPDRASDDLPRSDPVLLEQIAALREEAAIPALSLAEFTCESRRQAWDGVLRNDESMRVSPGARFSLGSNAKSMLATIALKLADEGHIDLNAPLGEIWPQAVVGQPDAAPITLAQLLSHSSGLRGFASGESLAKVPTIGSDENSPTQVAARWFLEQPLIGTPGGQTVYSNAGYVVAGALLERAVGRSFEEIMRVELFSPLGLDAEFGEPRQLSETDPHGHYVSDGAVVPYVSEEPPLPAFLVAAGNVAMTMDSYVDYLQLHLCGLLGRDSKLLTPTQVMELHRVRLVEGAAMGWGVTKIKGTVVSFHIGGTGDFTAYAALSPGRDIGVAALLNVGGAPAAPVQAWLLKAISP